MFNGKTFPLDQINRNLCHATDCLLTVLSAKGANEDYIMNKMCGACQLYSNYFKERFGTGKELFESNKDSFIHLSTNYSFKFESLVKSNKEMVHHEVLLIRFISALYKYLLKVTNKEPSLQAYIDVPINLNEAIQKMLDYLFRIRLNIEYPDKLVNSEGYGLRISCKDAWAKWKASID